MLGDITVAQNIYIACGYTDMRKSIDGLASLVKEQFQMNPFESSLYLLCGHDVCHKTDIRMIQTDPFETVLLPEQQVRQ